jgi:hypothetical protein
MRSIIIVLIIVFLIIPLTVYYYYFGSGHLSGDFKNWFEFSAFYILYATLFNGVILALLTWRIHQENRRLNQPILIFTIKADYPSHTIKNIGNGVALNIEIYKSTSNNGWDTKIKGLTLGKGEEFILWIPGQNRLGATYFDQSGNLHRSYMANGFMRIQNIEQELSQKPENETFVWDLTNS